jgi:hypothetical protein
MIPIASLTSTRCRLVERELPLAVAGIDIPLRDAVMATITYSDLFDFPLEPAEVWRDLIGLTASAVQTHEAVDRLLASGDLARVGSYVVTPARTGLAEIRTVRRDRARRMWPVARRLGACLGQIPFVRMVAVTGSLAAGNPGEDADLDYVIITVPGRLWLVRAMAVTLGRLVRPIGVKLCPNYLLSTRVLELDNQDLFTAHELLQAVPIVGGVTYQEMLARNGWSAHWLPNRFQQATANADLPSCPSGYQRAGEAVLDGTLASRFDAWESRRKRRRLDTMGGSARFTNDLCEGHYHHHRQRVLTEFLTRCTQSGMKLPVLRVAEISVPDNDFTTSEGSPAYITSTSCERIG